MTYLQKLKKLNRYRGQGKHAERICSELIYLDGVSKNHGNRYGARIEAVVDYLLDEIGCEGVLTLTAMKQAEDMLSDLSPVAKSYTELFISHAHIDMNWMWGYNETAALTVDTFRTVLDLMKEYPEMTFGQSQASTYEIVEKFAPEMLDEIKCRIHEGRWEVTAAEWVEPDKNMPDGESLTRQVLQTKKYLSKLLDLDPAELDLDFVPDTFGHNLNVPEVLANAGIRYMYHCRGYDGTCLYYYVSPSGKKTLNYREFAWYNGEIAPDKFEMVPDFCGKEKVDTYLCVFGVGDHGGGPSRRDIERIMEYQTWPLTPTIRFGTFHEFFGRIEACGTVFPEMKQEMNSLFTGCYTTQSRIKMANRIAEARINETEALSAAASLLAEAPREADRLDVSWRNILFNHFHDILPGSGTIETREYAMGRFQDTLAAVNTYGNLSMRRMAEAIDTSSIPFELDGETVSEGGGVGFYQEQSEGYRFPSTERGRGAVRAFHLFNPTGYDRDEYAEITVWDYHEGFDKAVMTDAEGTEIPFCLLHIGNGYWAHQFAKLLVKVKIPAFGYTTVVLKQRAVDGHMSVAPRHYERLDEFINDAPVVMESDLVKAVFDKRTMHLISLVDKKTGETLIDRPSCYFRYADENPIYGMTSWRVGPYMNIRDLNAESDVRFFEIASNAVLSRIGYEIKFGASLLRCTIVLKRDSSVLEFSTYVDWNEPAVEGQKIPQISFAVPVSYQTVGTCRCDIPYGEIQRKAVAHDMPALSYLTVEGETDSVVALMTDTKYGYRLWEDTASVTLIRSAYNPDPYPERGIHNIRIGVAVGSASDVKTKSSAFNHPVAFTPAKAGTGRLPLSGSMLSVEGNVQISCVKNAEDGQGTAVRLYNVNGQDAEAALRFCRPVVRAVMTDSNENALGGALLVNGTVKASVPAYSVVTLVAYF